MVHQSGDFTPPPLGREFPTSKPSEQSQVHETSGKEQGRDVKTLSKQDSSLIKNVQSYVDEKIHPPQKNTLPTKEYKKFKFSKTFVGKVFGSIMKRIKSIGSSRMQDTAIGNPTLVKSSAAKQPDETSKSSEITQPEASHTNPKWTSATPTAATTPPKTETSASTTPAEAQTSESVRRIAASSSRLPLDEEVRNEVERFLFPYLTGQITAETDNPNRGPLVDAILVKLAEKGFPDLDAKRGEIEAIALKAYFNEAARGIGRQLGKRKPSKEEMQQPVQVMAQALVPALAIDFPNLKFSAKEIEPRVKEAIDSFNRNAANLEAEISTANDEREESRVFQQPRKERAVALLQARELKGELFLTEAEHAALDAERAIYDNNQVQIYGRNAELTLYLDPKNPEGGTNYSLQPNFRGGKFHTLIAEKEGKETFSKVAISLAQIKATEEFRTQLPPGWKEAPNNAKLADLGVQVFQDPDKNNFIFNDLGQLQMLSQKELKKLLKERR